MLYLRYPVVTKMRFLSPFLVPQKTSVVGVNCALYRISSKALLISAITLKKLEEDFGKEGFTKNLFVIRLVGELVLRKIVAIY